MINEKSPWGGFDVYVLPDDDEEALAAGFPERIVEAVTDDNVVVLGSRLYARATHWARVKAEIARQGKPH